MYDYESLIVEILEMECDKDHYVDLSKLQKKFHYKGEELVVNSFTLNILNKAKYDMKEELWKIQSDIRQRMRMTIKDFQERTVISNFIELKKLKKGRIIHSEIPDFIVDEEQTIGIEVYNPKNKWIGIVEEIEVYFPNDLFDTDKLWSELVERTSEKEAKEIWESLNVIEGSNPRTAGVSQPKYGSTHIPTRQRDFLTLLMDKKLRKYSKGHYRCFDVNYLYIVYEGYMEIYDKDNPEEYVRAGYVDILRELRELNLSKVHDYNLKIILEDFSGVREIDVEHGTILRLE